MLYDINTLDELKKRKAASADIIVPAFASLLKETQKAHSKTGCLKNAIDSNFATADKLLLKKFLKT